MGLSHQLLAAAQTVNPSTQPFIGALKAATFSRESFRIYATQLYPLVFNFTEKLRWLKARSPHPDVENHLQQNIIEEEGLALDGGGNLVPVPGKSHPALFERFLAALGAASKDPSQPEETKRSNWFEKAIQKERWFGPAAYLMVGMEGNVPPTFAPIRAYLRDRCGFDESEIVFFSEHIDLDKDHAKMGAELIEQAASRPQDHEEALMGAKMGARSWWAFHNQLVSKMTAASPLVCPNGRVLKES